MLILLLAAGLGLLTIRFQRIFMEYAVNVCEDSAIKEINTLMEDEVFSHPDEFADLVVLERDSDNRITALRSNMSEFNRLQVQIADDILERLSDVSSSELSIPVGTLTGSSLLAGRGPSIHVRMQAVGSAKASLRNAFTSAGINQTRHRILIEVHAGFRILTPFGGEDREIVSTYPVTDTVIVGTVPERYAYISGSGSDLLGEIRDYDSEK